MENPKIKVNTDEIGKLLLQLAKKQWEDQGVPILLSSLSMKLRDELKGADVKKVLGGSIKAFIEKTKAKFGYQLVEHPTQKAKVALVPPGLVFSFKEQDAAASDSDDGAALLRILAKLSPEEQQNLTIPASVIVKLFSAK